MPYITLLELSLTFQKFYFQKKILIIKSNSLAISLIILFKTNLIMNEFNSWFDIA